MGSFRAELFTQSPAKMLKLLEHQRFLTVLDSSGCGKSSLVRAGLLPEIEDGFLTVPRWPDETQAGQWHLVTMRPVDDPYRELGVALAKDLAISVLSSTPADRDRQLQAVLKSSLARIRRSTQVPRHNPDAQSKKSRTSKH